MTRKQWDAFDLLRRSRRQSPTTDDGVMSTETFFDVEIGVAFVHWRTARALRDRGLVEFGPYDPDNGTSLTLTTQGLAGLS